MKTSENVITAELLTIGDEILFGQIVNTNAQWLGTELSAAGIRVLYHSSVGDDADAITQAVDQALRRVHIVLVTGGLGPTKDDITKVTLARYFQCGIEEHPQALADLEYFLRNRNRALTDLNRGQATLPTAATYLHNAIGTAPGMWFEKEGHVLVSMPGVPAEMKSIMTQHVIPALVQKFTPPAVVHRIVRTIGVPESVLAQKIEHWEDSLPSPLALAYLPRHGQVMLRITGTGEAIEVLNEKLDRAVKELLPLIQEHVFGLGMAELEEVLGKRLAEAGTTLATAESFTGGTIGRLITGVAGSSAYYKGGSIAYDNEVKIEQLGVDRQLIIDHGAVSWQVAEAMAAGARERLGTTYAISTTGVAGPGGGTDLKPVGLAYLGLAYPGGVAHVRVQMHINREINVLMGSYFALNLLRKHLDGLPLEGYNSQK